MALKVLLLSRYERLGASSRLRFYQYLPWLAAQGIDVTVAPLFDNGYLQGFYREGRKSPAAVLAAYFRRLPVLARLGRYDLVWIEGEILPWLPAWVETALTWAEIPYVVDYDDAIFHRYDQHPRALVRRVLGAKIDAVMRRARVVVAGSDYLAERARAAGAARVEWLPTAIDLARYPATADAPGDGLTLGWIGSRSTASYLCPLREVLSDLAGAVGLRVRLIGAVDPSLIPCGFEYREWSEDSEVAEIQAFDIGIMPLPDAPWEQGKCGYKLIQYMGCHKPVIASPVGANTRIVTPGVNGFLATTPEQWRAALLALIEDADLRQRLGQAGRALVERDYCTQRNAPRLAAILRAAAGR